MRLGNQPLQHGETGDTGHRRLADWCPASFMWLRTDDFGFIRNWLDR